MKTKIFDCVEMKQRAQEQLRAEYEVRSREFASYWEFLQRNLRESTWQTALWTKFLGGEPKRNEYSQILD